MHASLRLAAQLHHDNAPSPCLFRMHLCCSDWAMAYYLMEEIGVAGIPLSRFLSAPNHDLYQHYVRFAFWQDEPTLADATWRLQEHLPGKL